LAQRKEGLGTNIVDTAEKFNEVNEIHPTAPFSKSM
jgi:hypothetical protein